MSKIVFCLLLLARWQLLATDHSASAAAKAINLLGIDLLPKDARQDQNFVISPYSIQFALAMAYAGAEGLTRAEMAKTLHYPPDEARIHHSFGTLQKALDKIAKDSLNQVEAMKKWEQVRAEWKTLEPLVARTEKDRAFEDMKRKVLGDSATNNARRAGTDVPIVLTAANRLFGQEGYAFRQAFLQFVKENYGAPFGSLNFAADPASATARINGWVKDQTGQRIQDLIPDGALNELTRLILVNAIYLMAPWEFPFEAARTEPQSFHIAGEKVINVPTMVHEQDVGYARQRGFSTIAIPYAVPDLQFVIFLPEKMDGLAALERKITVSQLEKCSRLQSRKVILFMPRFKIEPPLFPLGSALRALGMKSAFDQPPGSANFDRIAPRRAEEYLALSHIFHKTFLSVDEKGTEAAAATEVETMLTLGMGESGPSPIEVHVDHPFLFAIQHRPTGACLFLGHVTNPK